MSAQYGTAPNNYYPENYNGSTFKGAVTDTADNHVTLTFTNGSKTDSFTGVFETGCSVPARDGRRMMPADIPKGTVMTAFFNATTKKLDGKKIKENRVFSASMRDDRSLALLRSLSRRGAAEGESHERSSHSRVNRAVTTPTE
jgi:hypothetical protein